MFQVEYRAGDSAGSGLAFLIQLGFQAWGVDMRLPLSWVGLT